MQSAGSDVVVGSARPVVVCLHSSASSARQWRKLGEDWPEFDVLTPNLVGYGEQPWEPGLPHDLADEVRVIRRAIKARGEPVHLVGHSFGGAVATEVALEMPGWIRTLTLFEPVLFPLLYEAAEDSGREVWVLQTDVRRLVRLDKHRAAAQRFVDYWSGAGAFRKMSQSSLLSSPTPSRNPICESSAYRRCCFMGRALRLPPGTSPDCWRAFCRAGNCSDSRASATWAPWRTRNG
jgi:pimeloyl-ACP methyl ester carboxylesterase